MNAVDILKNDSVNTARVIPALAMLQACAKILVAVFLAKDGMVNALVNAFRNNGSNRVLQAKSSQHSRHLVRGYHLAKGTDSGGLGAF